MPSKDIPCEDCESEKQNIELAGTKRVTSCDPIPGQDGWCRIEWENVDDDA